MKGIEPLARLGIGLDANCARLFIFVHVHEHRAKVAVASREREERKRNALVKPSEEARCVLDPRRRYGSAIRAEGHAGLSDRHARLTSAVAVRRITAVDVIEPGPLEAIDGNSLSGLCDHQRIGHQCKTEQAPPPRIQLVHGICPRTLGPESVTQTVCDPRSEITESVILINGWMGQRDLMTAF